MREGSCEKKGPFLLPEVVVGFSYCCSWQLCQKVGLDKFARLSRVTKSRRWTVTSKRGCYLGNLTNICQMLKYTTVIIPNSLLVLSTSILSRMKMKEALKKQDSRAPYCLSLSRHVIFSLRLPSSLEVREKKGYGTENANWKMRHISTTTNAKRSRNGRRLQKVKSIFLHYATIIVLKINGLQ